MTAFTNPTNDELIYSFATKDGDTLTTKSGAKWVWQGNQWCAVTFAPSSPIQNVTATSSAQGVANIKAGDVNVSPEYLAAEGSFSIKRCSYLKSATLANDPGGLTFQDIIAAELPFNAVRFHIPNFETAAVTINKTVCGCRGSITTGAASWLNVTFGGAASGVVPARVSADVPGWLSSDLVPLLSLVRNDGLGSDLPLLYVRREMAAAQASFSATPVAEDLTWLASGTLASANSGRVWKTEKAIGAFATTPAGWTGAAQVGYTMPLVVEFLTLSRGITVLLAGDSIPTGSPSDSTQTTNSYAYQASVALSTPARPVSLVNAGWGGESSDKYHDRIITMISLLRPDVVMYAPFTVNDGTPADYRVAWQLGRFANVLATAKAVGAKVVAINGMCNTDAAWTAGQDAFRTQFNAALVTMGVPVVDQDSVVSDGASPARFKAGASVDGRHPTAVKYAEITPLAVAALKLII